MDIIYLIIENKIKLTDQIQLILPNYVIDE
jgi:hypothetical protein